MTEAGELRANASEPPASVEPSGPACSRVSDPASRRHQQACLNCGDATQSREDPKTRF
jgi:hypothetical protein